MPFILSVTLIVLMAVIGNGFLQDVGFDENIFFAFIVLTFGIVIVEILISSVKIGSKIVFAVLAVVGVVIMTKSVVCSSIILMVLLIPLSRKVVGQSYGSIAFIMPLSLGAAPFVARIIEGALKEVDEGLIEASKAMGATVNEIIFKVMIPEALPSLVHGITLTLISLIGYSAMAGTIGGGGLGNAAVIDGFQRNNPELMWQATVVTIILVQIIQFIGDRIVKALLEKRKRA